MVMLTEGNRFI